MLVVIKMNDEDFPLFQYRTIRHDRIQYDIYISMYGTFSFVGKILYTYVVIFEIDEKKLDIFLHIFIHHHRKNGNLLLHG